MKDLTLKFNETLKDRFQLFNSLCWIICFQSKTLFSFFFKYLSALSVFSLFTGFQKTYRNIVFFIFQKGSLLPRQPVSARCHLIFLIIWKHEFVIISIGYYIQTVKVFKYVFVKQVCVYSKFLHFFLSQFWKKSKQHFIQKSIARLMEASSFRNKMFIEESKCHSYFHKEHEGRPKELQVNELHLNCEEDDGAANFGNLFHAHIGK